MLKHSSTSRVVHYRENQTLIFMKSFNLFIFLTLIVGSRTFAQDQQLFNLESVLKFDAALKLKAARAEDIKRERAKEVMQDNEYESTGHEAGVFFCNPLMLDGKPLDYGEFNLLSTGELTVNKGDSITGHITQVPFYVYLRRRGNKVVIPGMEMSDPGQCKIDIAEILRYAEPGDHLVIEAVRKEDGPVKRILKLLGLGC